MLQKLSHVERTVPKPVHEANLSFDPFIVIRGGSGQAGVKKLVLPAPDANRDGEPRFPRSLNKPATNLPRNILIELCKLKFLFFLKQLIQYVIHGSFLQ